MIKVYYANIDCLDDNAVAERLYHIMPAERKTKIDRLYFMNDKMLSLAAGALREYALSEHPDFNINLSHSGKTALCIAGDCSVGCDVEKIKEANLLLAERFFTAFEYEAISSSDNPNNTFFRLWTLKEAFMKCLGLGFALPMDRFSIDLSSGYRLSYPDAKKEFYFKEFNSVPGYMISCCADSSDLLDAEIEEVDLSRILLCQ